MATSLSRRRATAKHNASTANRDLAAIVAEQKADATAAHKAAVAAHNAREAARAPIHPVDILGAVAVRSRIHGWRKVRRVNTKSVSVDSGYSWPDYIAFKDVLEVRK